MKQLDKSPITNKELEAFLTCKDYTVSGKLFSIVKDQETELLVTSPRPNNEDLGKYYESEDYISHSDSKKSLLDKVYQIVRNHTIKQKVKLINSFTQTDKTILDIGTGTGDFLVACKNNNWIVSGVEPNKKARALTEKKLRENNVIHASLEDLKFSTYDTITMWHVLEHVPNLIEYISTLKKLLKPNGTLIVAVPNHKSFDASYYGKLWAAYDVPRHLWHFSQTSIKELFAKENMKVIKTLPMKFDAFYVSLLSEKYKTKKMNPVKAFYIGLRSNLKARGTKEYSSLIYVIKNV